MSIPYAPHKPSQPSESQSSDTSEYTSAPVPLSEESNLQPPNYATSGLPASQDVNEGDGEAGKQIPEVSLASSITNTSNNLIPIHYAQHKLFQPSSSQSSDTSEKASIPIPLPEASNSPTAHGAIGSPPPSQDANKGSGKTEKQTPKVSILSSIIRPRNLSLSVDRKSTRLNSSHSGESRMPSSA